MKFVIFVIAALGLASTFPKTRDLTTDLDEIVALLPIEEWSEIGRRYIEADFEVQTVVLYLQGDEFHIFIDSIADNETWQMFKLWAATKGVDVDAIVEAVHEFIEGIEVPSEGGNAGGVRAFLDEITAITPSDAILTLVNDKLQNSADFQELYENISSDEAREFVEWFLVQEEAVRLIETLRNFGVDVDTIKEFIYAFLGWE